MMTIPKRDWQELCAAASKEQDSERLKILISELVKALDEPNGDDRAERHDDVGAA